MEKKLIKLLLDREFYENNRHRVVRTMFPGELASLYDTIVEGHTRYERTLTLDEVRALHKTLHPTLTRAARNNIEELLVDVDAEEAMGPDVAQDVLKFMWRVETGRRIADAALEIMDGKSESLQPVMRIIERASADFTPQDEVVPVTTDVDELLEALDNRESWKFNITNLRKVVPGGAAGDFGIIFARPEVGKTALWVSLCAGPDGFAAQGARVHALINEEPAVRTMMRAITAQTGMTKEQVRDNRGQARALFEPVRKNLVLFDSIDMTMEGLNVYCERNKPDVLVIDQLDKVHVHGSFARDDLKLREIYMQAREIAKRHKCFVIGVSQASADAEGKTRVHYSMMENSKTGKAAEADIIIGVGARPVDENATNEDLSRFLTVSKNKITGWHGTINCLLHNQVSRYVD